jgi:hypothetical protein
MIISSSTFGLMSGRHATAVAAIAKNGKNILKVYTAPYNPKSLKQLTQRAMFSMVNKRLSPMHGLYKVSFLDGSGIHKAVSSALKMAVTGTYPDFDLDLPKLIFSIGNVFGTTHVTVDKTTGTTIKVDWDTTPESEYAEDSNVNMVFMNADTEFCILRQNQALRSVGTLTYELPVIFAGAQVHCWIYLITGF